MNSSSFQLNVSISDFSRLSNMYIYVYIYTYIYDRKETAETFRVLGIKIANMTSAVKTN